MKDSLNSGESIYLLLVVSVLGKTPRDLEVNGVTAHCRPLNEGGWRVGVKFIDLTPWEKEDWEVYLTP